MFMVIEIDDLPVKNWETVSEKLLQLFLMRSYVLALNLSESDIRKAFKSAFVFEVIPMSTVLTAGI